MGFETAMADAAAFFVTCMGLVSDHAANLWHDVARCLWILHAFSRSMHVC